MTRPITTERILIAGIPALHVRPADLEGPAPTIIFHHGWSSYKERNVITAEALAAESFRVILPDARCHGERNAFPRYDLPEVLINFWDVIYQTVEEAQGIAQAAIDAGWADPQRMGTAGHSMGGMIASAVFARSPWARTAVILNGCPSLEWLQEVYRQAKGAPPITPAELDRVRFYDPERSADRIAPRPLLMLHGDADQVVPVGGVRRFYDLVKPFYTEYPDHLRLEEIPRLNHYVTVRMVDSMRTWFKQHL